MEGFILVIGFWNDVVEETNGEWGEARGLASYVNEYLLICTYV
jgi:hypothetical protein